MFQQIPMRREIFGNGENLLICGDALALPREIRNLQGAVQCVYLDPPYMTGESFTRSRPYGTKGWRRGSPVVRIPAYADRFEDEAAYRRMLRGMIRSAWKLLADTGVLYLHLDWRMVAEGRRLCDQVFGREMFLNEIIWGFESGGRSRRFFPRKHETILLYGRSRKYRFDLTRVPLDRQEKRRNHMARGMDEDGRMYSSIVSHGKEYRYYDDQPVYPGDVWTDISHLQQRDPERTGYATQKPLKLLERLLLPVTKPGDWVADLCCGSGTTLAAAQKLGCRFAGLDAGPDAVAVSLARLEAENLTVLCPQAEKPAELLTEETENRFRVLGLAPEPEMLPRGGTAADALEAWETGILEEDGFRVQRRFQRSFRYPELATSLQTDPAGISAVLVTDAAGGRRLYRRRPG